MEAGMKAGMTIRAKITLLVSIPVGIIFVSVVWLLGSNFQSAVQDGVYGQVNEQAVALGNRLETDIGRTLEQATALSWSVSELQARDNIDRETLAAVMAGFLARRRGATAVWMLVGEDRDDAFELRVSRDGNGTAEGPVFGIDSELDTLYGEAFKERSRRLGNPLMRSVDGRSVPVITASVPLEIGGGVAGVVGVDFTAEAIQEIVGEVNPLGAGYAFLFANDTSYVAHPNDDQIGRSILEVRPDATDRDADVRAGRPRTEEQVALATGDRSYFVFQPIDLGDDSRPWSIVMTVNLDTLLADSEAALRLVVLLAGGGLLLVVILVFFVVKALTGSLGSVAYLLEEIAEGGGDLTHRLPVASGDEVGRVSNAFNSFNVSLAELISTVKDSALALKDVGEDLSSNMTETSSAVSEITANIESVKSQVVNQSSGVTETSATIEEMVKNIESLNRSIETQATNVNESSSAIEQMVANIQSVGERLERNKQSLQELLSASDEGRRKIDEMTTLVAQISKESEGLLEANSMIESIAAQTNLLAMNAAIEAAHAGDSGKGFAVVASEIRSLAENSSQQSKSISTLLKKLKASIENVHASATESARSFELILGHVHTVNDQEEEIKGAMDEQSAGSTQVLEALSGITRITTEVNEGSSELLTGSRTIQEEMNRLSEITLQITQSMDEMAGGAAEINESTTHVVEVSERNRSSIDQLLELTSSFKLTNGESLRSPRI